MKGVCQLKSGDIKDAYNAVKATAELKEKLLLMSEEASDEKAAPEESEDFVETSLITVKEGGKLKKAVSALCVVAAAIAVVFALRLVGTEDIEYPAPPRRIHRDRDRTRTAPPGHGGGQSKGGRPERRICEKQAGGLYTHNPAG